MVTEFKPHRTATKCHIARPIAVAYDFCRTYLTPMESLMKRFMFSFPAALFGLTLFIGISTVTLASCGASGCPIQYSLQSSMAGKWGIAMDYTYINQTTLMTGSNAMDAAQSTMHHTEIETYSRFLNTHINYQITDQWGVSSTIPVVWRKHAHTHHHHGAALHDEWELSGFGDTWIDGSYSMETILWGNPLIAEAGIKLPTGVTRLRNGAGAEAEVPIQPGSGSTDYRWGLRTKLPAQFFVQYTLNGIGTDGWKTGNEIVAGVRTDGLLNPSLRLLAGLTGRYRTKADAGTTRESINSTGGKSVIADLGLEVSIMPKMTWSISSYLPIYQFVNGEQLGLGSIIQTRISVPL